MKPNPTLRDRMARLLPAGGPRYIRCYDNGGPSVSDGSIDRYTVVFTGRMASKTNGGEYPYLAMNAAPFHPQGFGQHGSTKGRPCDVRPGSWSGPSLGRKCHLGTRIEFTTLPEDCRRLVMSDYCAIWNLPQPAEYLSPMVRAYLVAALWTEDDDARSGDHEPNGHPADLWHLFAGETIERARADCVKFACALSPAGVSMRQLWENVGISDESAGHDLWLTRNRHGSGFWDRDGDKAVLQSLTDAAHALGECDLYQGDDKRLYFS